MVELLRREIKAAVKLVPWLAVSLLVVALLWRADLAAITGLYQSPNGVFQSPPENTPEPSPTTAPTEAPTVEPTVPRVTATPTTEASPTIPVEVSATPMPTDAQTPTTVPEVTSTLPVTTTTPTASPTPIPSQTPVPSATAAAEPTGDPRYSDGESDLTFDWGMLVDSVALGLSYMWLCCGGLILLGIPVLFIVLWVASNRRRQAQELEETPEPPSEQGQEEG